MPLTEENKNIVEVSCTKDVSNTLGEEMEVDVTVDNIGNIENKIQISVQISNTKENETEQKEEPTLVEEEKNLSTIQEQAENDDSGTIEDTEKLQPEEMENDDNSMGSFEQVHADEQDIEDFLDAQEDSVELYDDTLLADADGVITFNMTLEKRLRELSDVFEHFAQGGLSLRNFWALYAETYVEPAGWTGLYRPKQNTTDLSCSTTSNHEYEVVEVEQVNFITLDARVKRIQEGEQIQNEEVKKDSNEHSTPEGKKEDKEEDEEENDADAFFVSLLDLHPLAKQENGALNMKLTAKCIDNYRFFERHLFLPWDEEEAFSWYMKNLETRIQLYYDLQSGIISETMSKEIYGLIQEAKENQIKISKLEDQLDFHDSDTDIDEHIVMQVFPLHTRQEEIQIRLQQLQNPFFRNMLTTMNLIKKRRSLRVQEKVILIAQKSFTCQELLSDLEFVRSQVDENEKIRIVNTLQEALEICERGVKIFVTTGIHPISGLCNLEEGGQIIGVPSPDNEKEKVVIETRDAGDCFLSINTENTVHLENVFIRIGSKYTAPMHTDNNDSSYLESQPASYLGFLVSKGTLKLNNVSLEGFTESGVGCDEIETNGIKVLTDGSCTMTNCNIHQFNKGIVARSESVVEMKSSVIENCLIGIESSSETNFKLTDVTIKKCLKFGMLVKWKDDDVETTIGGAEDILQTLPKCTVESTIISECIAGDVCFCSEGNLSMRNGSMNESNNI